MHEVNVNSESFEWALCQAKFSKKDSLINHYKVGHSVSKSLSEEKKMEGQIESVALDNVSRVECYKDAAKVINPFQCGLCNKQFAQLNRLESHLQEVHKS